MPTPVTMPQLGESVTEGTVTRWLKQVGERVEMDEPLLEVSTDKVDTEIPSPVAGVLVSIDAADDAIIEVGGLLGAIATPDETGGGTAPGPAAPSAAAPGPASPPMPPPSFPPPAFEPEPPAPAPATTAPEEPDAAAAPTVAVPPEAPAEAEPPAASGTEVRLPELGESVTEGTITRWLKREGDEVALDEPLVEISTDKVDTEIPSPTAGTLIRIAAAEDDVVAVGGLLAVVGTAAGVPREAAAAPIPSPQPAAETPAEVPAAAEPAVEQAPAMHPQSQAAIPQPTAAPPAAEPTQVAAATAYVTPLVRKLASQAGIDLAGVTGTGVGGRIRRQDVEAAVRAQESTRAAAPSAPAAAAPPADADSQLRGSTVPMTRLRRVIADRMVESLHTSAQLTTVVEVDITAIARLRTRVKDRFLQREGVKLSFLPFFALAVIEALKVHPVLNASIDSETGNVTYHDREALGVAVDTERGLLVPVIQDAGGLNLAGLARRIADLAERTRTNKVTPDELAGGTFTLTNTGSRGALFDTPIINQPQVGILGTGAVVKRPVVVPGPDGGDMIGVHSMVYLALTYDHRIVDGADAARFLGTVKHRLEEGAFEGELGL